VFFRKKRAQTISEYVILITIVAAAVISMFTYVKRGTQGLVRAAADQIGSQVKSEQDFNSLGGYISSANTITSSYANQAVYGWPGAYEKVFVEGSDTQTNTESNLGFSEM
jgi:hypothetical protein